MDQTANGAAVGNGQNGTAVDMEPYQLKFSTVCASNNNRYVNTKSFHGTNRTLTFI